MSERICVCGLGKVGRPILKMLRQKGFKVVGYDRVPAQTEVDLSTAVDQSDACIFIVQTPSLPDGSFSNGHLQEALIRFKHSIPMLGKPDYLYIVTSTTTPGSCDEFRKIVGDNIVYKPEFIRLEHVDADLLAPSFILIGEANTEAGYRAERLYRQVADVPVKRMSLIEAELAKITLNCALTMKISLANQVYLIAKKIGVDASKIMEAVGADPRIGLPYLIPGRPYEGPCLPRDNSMFRYYAGTIGVPAPLSLAADEINRMVKE